MLGFAGSPQPRRAHGATMTYVGVILGMIGTLIGVGGLWLSYKNYRWIKSQKTTDIRLDLAKSVISAHELANVVQRTIRSAQGSRNSLLAASGAYNSGARAAMEQNIRRDREVVDDIIKLLPPRSATFTASTDEEIAENARKVHDAHERLATLKTSYEAELRSDEQAINRHAQSIHRQ